MRHSRHVAIALILLWTAISAEAFAQSGSQSGNVVEASSGGAIVELGTADGLERGDHVEFFRERTVDLGKGEQASRVEPFAVGEVRAVSDNRAQVDVGINERVAPGARARPTDRSLTTSVVSPPRIGNVWETKVGVRPFVAVSNAGGGALTEARLTYRFDGPFAVHANMLPAGLGFGDRGTLSSFSGDVVGAYDAQGFSVGLGVGAAQSNLPLRYTEEPVNEMAMTVAQTARVGARDGMHLKFHNSFMLNGGSFVFHGLFGWLQFPIHSVVDKSWFVIHGGGNRAGYSIGELGLRMLVRGNGDRGSLFVTPTVGGTGIINHSAACSEDVQGSDTPCERNSYGSPVVGINLEWRL